MFRCDMQAPGRAGGRRLQESLRCALGEALVSPAKEIWNHSWWIDWVKSEIMRDGLMVKTCRWVLSNVWYVFTRITMSSSILKINIFDAFMKVNHTQCNVRNALMNGDKVKCAYITSASLNSLQSCSSSRKRKNLINSSTHIFGVSLQVEVFIYNTCYIILHYWYDFHAIHHGYQLQEL